MKFYRCSHCGNIVTKLTDGGAPLMCCGEKMQLLEAGETDAAQEKHVPVFTQEGNVVVVQVGQMPHPMVEEHWIEWIVLETDRGAAIHWLSPGQPPKAVFQLAHGEKLKTVWEYCNLHGLWKADN